MPPAYLPARCAQAVDGKFKEIEKVLRIKTTCLEEVDEARKYIEGLPNKVRAGARCFRMERARVVCGAVQGNDHVAWRRWTRHASTSRACPTT